MLTNELAAPAYAILKHDELDQLSMSLAKCRWASSFVSSSVGVAQATAIIFGGTRTTT